MSVFLSFARAFSNTFAGACLLALPAGPPMWQQSVTPSPCWT